MHPELNSEEMQARTGCILDVPELQILFDFPLLRNMSRPTHFRLTILLSPEMEMLTPTQLLPHKFGDAKTDHSWPNSAFDQMSSITSTSSSEEISDLNGDSPQESDTDIYQRCLIESIQTIEALTPLESQTSLNESVFTCDSLFSIEKRSGAPVNEKETTRYRSRAGARFYFKMFPWFLYLLEKKKTLPGNYLFRETIEFCSMKRIVEAMNYFYWTGSPYQQDEIKYLNLIFHELNWERDQERTVFTRIIQVYQAFRAYRTVTSGESVSSFSFFSLMVVRTQRGFESASKEKISLSD
jgi:hypothetical protein